MSKQHSYMSSAVVAVECYLFNRSTTDIM